MKWVYLWICTTVFVFQLAAQDVCKIYLGQDDMRKIVESTPIQVLKNTEYNYREIRNFRLLEVKPQEALIRCHVHCNKWEKIPIIKKKIRTLSIGGDVDFTIHVQDLENRIDYNASLYRILVNGIPQEFLDLLVPFLQPFVQRTLFTINATQSNLGGTIACYIGTAPEIVPVAYSSFSYIHPAANHLVNICKTQILERPDDLSRLNLVYLARNDCLSITRPIQCSGGTTIEFIQNTLSFPRLEIRENSLALSLRVQFQELRLRRPQGIMNFSQDVLDIHLPVRCNIDGDWLRFELADQQGQIQFLQSTPNEILSILLEDVNRTYRELLRLEILRLRIDRQRLNIPFSLHGQSKVFRFQDVLLHDAKIFFFFNIR